jgi:hypothetical protein
MSERLLIGIAMVRDEDVWIDHAVRNVLESVDAMILVDHLSQDRTPRIMQEIAHDFPAKASYHRVEHAGDANMLLREYVGQPAWVLGVDGDELYEPDRLARFRVQLVRGDFDHWYSIKGHSLHCTDLDLERMRATGHMAPPARTVTKLFNFGAIESWTGRAHEHFYGGAKQLREGYADNTILHLARDTTWDESPFRLLHVCFSRRSSLQPEHLVARRSVNEDVADTRRRRLRARIHALAGRPLNSHWKLERYRQGEPVTVDVSTFIRTPAASTAASPPRA